MGLRWQTIPIPFGQGLAQEVVPYLLGPGKLAQADNGHIDKQGSIQVRPGFQALTQDTFFDPTIGGVTLTAIHRLIGHGGETLVSNGYRVYSFAENEDQWLDKDHAYEATVAKRVSGERGMDARQLEGDGIYCNGYYAHTWYNEFDDEFHIRFTDAGTGTRFPDVTWAGDGSEYHRAFVVGTIVYVSYYDNGDLMAAKFDTADLETALNSIAFSYIATNVTTPPAHDVVVDTVGATTRVYVAYHYSSGPTAGICALKCDDTLTTLNSQIVTATVSRHISLACSLGGTAFIAYDQISTGVQVWTVTESSWALLTTPVVVDSEVNNPSDIRAMGIVDSGSDAIVVYERRNQGHPTPRLPELKARWISSTGTLGNGMQTYRIGMLSKPIMHEGQPYVMGYYHERSHTDVTAHESPGYPNRYGYLLHIPTGPCSLVEN